MTAVSEILQKFQIKNNLTQHEMAIALQVSQATYNNWVNGRTSIDPKYYPKIAVLCQINIVDLIPPNTKINITPSTFPKERTDFNALELYMKYTENLEESNRRLREENEKLQGALKETKSITSS